MRVICDRIAVEIFACKVLSYLKSPHSKEFKKHKCVRLCKELSKQYNISVKSIRDIWNFRTWRFETAHLWHLTQHKSTLLSQPSIQMTVTRMMESNDHEEDMAETSKFSNLSTYWLETISDEDPFHSDWQFWDRSYPIEDVIIFQNWKKNREKEKNN